MVGQVRTGYTGGDGTTPVRHAQPRPASGPTRQVAQDIMKMVAFFENNPIVFDENRARLAQHITKQVRPNSAELSTNVRNEIDRLVETEESAPISKSPRPRSAILSSPEKKIEDVAQNCIKANSPEQKPAELPSSSSLIQAFDKGKQNTNLGEFTLKDVSDAIAKAKAVKGSVYYENGKLNGEKKPNKKAIQVPISDLLNVFFAMSKEPSLSAEDKKSLNQLAKDTISLDENGSANLKGLPDALEHPDFQEKLLTPLKKMESEQKETLFSARNMHEIRLGHVRLESMSNGLKTLVSSLSNGLPASSLTVLKGMGDSFSSKVADLGKRIASPKSDLMAAFKAFTAAKTPPTTWGENGVIKSSIRDLFGGKNSIKAELKEQADDLIDGIHNFFKMEINDNPSSKSFDMEHAATEVSFLIKLNQGENIHHLSTAFKEIASNGGRIILNKEDQIQRLDPEATKLPKGAALVPSSIIIKTLKLNAEQHRAAIEKLEAQQDPIDPKKEEAKVKSREARKSLLPGIISANFLRERMKNFKV